MNKLFSGLVITPTTRKKEAYWLHLAHGFHEHRTMAPYLLNPLKKVSEAVVAKLNLMENLPYFLALIKKNIILYSIISSNSFNNINLKKYETVVWSHKVIEIKNFKLDNEHVFNSVMIVFSDLGLSITFSTSSSKYFDNPKEYFKRDSPTRVRNYEMFEKAINSNSKRLGEFDYFKPPVDVTLYKSTAYGYTINLWFIDREALNKIPDE